MNLNILTFTYLFLRLAPFIIVSFFALSSLFNQDFKGIVYLVGLLFSCFCSYIIYNPLSSYLFTPSLQPNIICNLVSFSENQTTNAVPVGQNILGFTFAYLMYAIIKYKYVKSNIPTIVFFPVLILFDAIWNVSHTCYNPFQLLFSLALGVSFGIIWGLLIDASKIVDIQYFNKVSGKAECSRPAKNTFKCSVYQGGKRLRTIFA
jgi:hypothetical protein